MGRNVHNLQATRNGYGIKKRRLKKWIYAHKRTQPYVARRMNMTVEDFKQKLKDKDTFNREQLKGLIKLLGAWEAFKVIYFPSKRKRRKVYWQVFGRYNDKEKINGRNEKIKR